MVYILTKDKPLGEIRLGKMPSSVEEYLGIIIDKSKDNLFDEKGLSLITKKGFYKKDHEDSPQQTFARAATCYCFGDYDFAQRIYEYASNHWFSNASPVLSNAVDIEWPDFGKGEFEEAGEWLEDNITPDGLPISCFLSMIADTRKGLVDTRHETAWLSMLGGGIGVYAGMRAPDEKSTGVISHMKGYDADTLSYKQKESRRGSIAAYLDIDHPEIKGFLEIRDPVSGGDINKKCFNMNHAVNITDDFMERVIRGDKYQLIDPKHGATGEWLDAREVWERILELRHQTGEPYLNFIDTVNRNINPWITKATYHVKQSNLCNEIHLMTSAKRTAVCCLSSLNIAKYDEWKDTQIVEDLVRYLDNVLEYFIRLAPPELKRAVHSASQERALGLGQLGWCDYFQQKGVPFESGGFNSAASLTHEISKMIRDRAIGASKQLAEERGEPEDCLGSGMRNSHLIAIAPNVSSSDIIGTTPSVEMASSNAFIAQGRNGSFIVKNKNLKKLLAEKYDKDTPDVWKSIMTQNGSVQWIPWMDEHDKLVYKTATEVDPMWVIELASIRQKNICQGQSINLYKDNTWSKQEMSDVHIAAWAKGLKGLYYMRGERAHKTNMVDGIAPPLNQIRATISFNPETCISCEG